MKRDLLRILIVNAVTIGLAVVVLHTGPLLAGFIAAVLVGYGLPLYTLIALVGAFRRRRLVRRIELADAEVAAEGK